MEKYLSYHFDPPAAVDVPPTAALLTRLHFTDGAGWYSLPQHEQLELKPTKFDDGRITFLDSMSDLPPVFESAQSGKFDVKCWGKGDNFIGIEGDQKVFIKLKQFADIASYNHSERLPAFVKTWKPIMFAASSSAATIRLTERLSLMLTYNNEKQLSVTPLDYDGGYLCSHPCLDLAFSYGTFSIKEFETISNIEMLPHLDCTKGNWGFYLQFYPWGCLYAPKTVELSFPSSVAGIGMGKKVDTLAQVFLPPNLFIACKLDVGMKMIRTVDYGEDFGITAKKTSDTDVEIWLLMDGQLMKAEHSFDIRINKAGKPKAKHLVKFRATMEKEDAKKPNPKLQFVSTKEASVVIKGNGPSNSIGHLSSKDLVAVFDAEISQYFTNASGIKLTSNFSKVATPGSQP